MIKTLIKLKNSGKAGSTTLSVSHRLSYLAKYANLEDPEEVKAFIASKKCSNSYKNGFVKAYNYYVQMNGLVWDKPKYKWERKIPRIPTIEAIDKIIARASKRYSVVFKLLAETGAMPFELHNVSQRDIDLERGTISITGGKGHSSRIFKLRQEKLAMLKFYIAENPQQYPFLESQWIGKMWRKFRNSLAEKIKDPSLKQIRLYDLRHYFGTMLYHKTKDILYTKQQMGHKKLETTLIYTQLVNFQTDEYSSAVAKNVKKAHELIEAGFEYVTEIEGISVFRKRK